MGNVQIYKKLLYRHVELCTTFLLCRTLKKKQTNNLIKTNTRILEKISHPFYSWWVAYDIANSILDVSHLLFSTRFKHQISSAWLMPSHWTKWDKAIIYWNGILPISICQLKLQSSMQNSTFWRIAGSLHEFYVEMIWHMCTQIAMHKLHNAKTLSPGTV